MSARGRKPKPTHLKLVTGNPGKRPLNKKEAKPKPVHEPGPPRLATGPMALPMPPPELLDEAKVEWGRRIDHLSRLGLLTELDTGAFAALCQSYGLWIVATRTFNEIKKRDPVFNGLVIKTKSGNLINNPLIGIANKAHADYVRYCAEFGMTPSARSRISIEAPPGEKDPAEEFFGKA